ncbi:hypothetical protein BS47DRAFT_1288052, partial [Hydnum rufescens UP504]
CSHLNALLANPTHSARFTKKHLLFVKWGAKSGSEESSSTQAEVRPVKRRKVQVPSCGTCGKALHRPFVCLECSYSACWREGHILDHLEETGHDFALDVNSGSIFCAGCDDLIYHHGLESVYNSAVLRIEERRTRFQNKKLGREKFKPWVPGPKDASVMSHGNLLSCQGRKGILNLGASCYLNVVLQVLIHNPLIRRHFMSDKHPTQLCSKDICMCCEMDKLFAEVYSPGNSPIAPTSFLHTLWRFSILPSSSSTSPTNSTSDIAGYAQHDAHEIFIHLLNALHVSARLSTSVSCVCVVHSIFGAQLQSDVKCGRCSTVRSTVDPILDVSLDLQPADGGTLASCLRRYTRIETLGPNEQVLCQTCNKPTEAATRRLSIRKLPPVLCFQFKRFEHTAITSAHKIDTPVRYPATLDVAPYTSLAIGMKASQGGGRSNTNAVLLGPQTQYEYELFAVVNHEGQLDTGHYTNFARYQDEWYKFDDDKVIPSTLGEALRSRAYMCFYVKKHLDYKPYQVRCPHSFGS